MWNIIKQNEVLSLLPINDPVPTGAVVIGQTIDEFILSPQLEPVPQQVTRFQARAALALTFKELNGEQINLFTMLESFMSSLPSTDLRRRAWEDALAFERQSVTVASISEAFGLTSEEVDNLFRLANTIEA